MCFVPSRRRLHANVIQEVKGWWVLTRWRITLLTPMGTATLKKCSS